MDYTKDVVISCLDAEATKIFKEDLESAKINIEAISHGKKLLQELISKHKI